MDNPPNKAVTGSGLIGTKALPAGLRRAQGQAREAWAYHNLNPYPMYHFRDWQTEDRGPLPRCLPLARAVVLRGARFLFGRPLQLSCPASPAWEGFVRDAWRRNGMGARLVPLAVRAALEGGVVLKFSYDEAAEVPLSVQSLSSVDQVRLYCDPHDRRRLLMGRVQYTYTDPADGRSYWYREEWTDAEMVVYAPLPAPEEGFSSFSPDSSENWVIARREENPFGLIPLHYVRNLEADDLWGAVDLEGVYRVLDNVHLTYHLMNRSNQFDSEVNPIFIDAELDPQDVDRPLQPGQPIDLKSEHPDQAQAKVQFPSGGNGLRPAMMEYARDLRQQVMAAAGSVEVNLADISHMGNMTRAVLTQTYLPLIEATEEKRKSWGEGGIVAFLSLVARGLSNAGVSFDFTDAPASYEVTLDWPDYFDLSEDEKAAVTARTQEQEGAGYLTHQRAVRRVARVEGVEDIEALEKELIADPPPAYANALAGAQAALMAGSQSGAQQAEGAIHGLQREGGPEAQ